MSVGVSKLSKEVEVKKFAKAFIENGGNATQAAMEVRGLKYDSARTVGMRLSRREDIKAEIRRALQEQKIDMNWLLAQRKKIITKGQEQLDNGYIPIKTDSNGQPIGENVKITPSDVHQHLQGIEKMIGMLGQDEVNTDSNTSHYHLHLENKTVKEVLQERKKHSDWFTQIIDGEKIDSTSGE